MIVCIGLCVYMLHYLHVCISGLVWCMERATERKSDKSKTVSKERQEYCRFELKFVFLTTKLTLILTVNDPYDG